MKKTLPSCLRGLLLSGMLLMMGSHSYASHIIGAELHYQYVGTCDSYKITVFLYGDCNPASFGSFQGLPISTPQVCIYDGPTSVATLFLGEPNPQCGTEVTPVCPDSLSYTTCTNTSYPISGIKKFIYTGYWVCPHPSATWRFVYTSNNGSSSGTYSCGGSLSGITGSGPVSSGRSASITNIVAGSSVQLIDTLNNSANNPRGHNSSPVLTVEPVPFYCNGYLDCYNPGAIDLYDVDPINEPSGDSLFFSLVPATNGTGGCGSVGGSVTYLLGATGANPLAVSTPIAFDPNTGQLCFTPSATQRSVVVYNIDEYVHDTLGMVTTFAGNLTAGGYSGDGGPATSAALHNPAGVCMDNAGNVYFADYTNNRIRKIDVAGNISTIAGNGTAGYAGDNGPATAATCELNHPVGIAVDQGGNIIVADFDNHAIRKINTVSGIISTISGTGTAGYAGDGGDALWGIINTIGGTGVAGYSGDGSAVGEKINNPAGICMDGSGNIYFADYANNLIREISSAGALTTIAGTPPPAAAGYYGDGGPALGAALHTPLGVAFDATYSNLYFTDYGNHVVRKIALGTGIITTVAGTGTPGFSGDGTAAASGIITTIAGNGTPGEAGDGGMATAGPCELNNPAGLCKDGAGNIYFSDAANNRIRKITPAGIITNFAGNGTAGYLGDGGAASIAELNDPMGLTINGTNLFFADYGNNVVREISLTTNIISTVAGNGTPGYAGDGGPANAATCQLFNPSSVAFDLTGNLYVADAGNNRIREIAAGIITTFAGNGTAGYVESATPTSAEFNNPFGICFNATGIMYIADAGNNRIRLITAGTGTLAGNGTAGSTDGSAAAAEFNNPTGVCTDGNGNVYIADRNNNKIRKILNLSGAVTTIVGNGTAGWAGDGGAPATAEINNEAFVYVDAQNNIYVPDFGNNRIREIVPAQLNHPTGIYVDGTGNIYVSDNGNQRVREVAAATGFISTIAGTGTPGAGADGVAATSSDLDNPYGLSMDVSGNLYIADKGSHRIRKITGTTITTVVGNGTPGFSGDNGPASAAELNGPTGVFLDGAGNMFIADQTNNDIRTVNSAGIITTIENQPGTPAYGGDGGSPVTATSNMNYFVCTDANKNVYFTDYANSRIREIKPTEYNHPIAVFVNPGGNIYISDTGNEVVRVITALTGVVSKIAGTPGTGGFAGDGGVATLAKINQPYGLWADNTAPTPNVYFADSRNNRIREISGGNINTIAGNTAAGFGGDGALATAATCLLNDPTDVFVDNRGMSWSYNKIIIADQGNNRIRMIDTCGDINTYDGNGTAGYTGDGGVPLAAEFNSPLFVITDPKENIYVTDFNDNHVREIVRNANVAKVQVGSMQREMNFLVQTCFYTSPTGEVDTFLGGGIHRIDSTHFYGCANSGNFILTTNPAESDTTLDITVTATGLPSGFVFSIGTTNNTPHPHDTVTVNTATVAPGNYTFYLTYTDNHCPLTGTNTTAFSVDILPVPTITDSLITHATCIDPAAYRIIPGGTGKPWTIKVTGGLGGPALDTFQVFASDTGAFVDSLKPGTDTLVIFTSVSNQCSVSLPITIDTSKFTISDAGVDPTYCGGNTGKIGVVGFGVTLGHPDTMYYDFNGVGQTPQPFIVPVGNIDTITGLYAGTYTHVVMQEGLCFSKDTLAAVTLNNPPFVFRSVTTKSPTQCGYCDGADTVWGMHPSQLDTITYTYSISGLAPFTTASVNHSIGSDSLDVITGLCAGYYTNIVVNTAGVCRDSLPGPYHLISPGLKDSFITATHYGCNGDTVMFTNFSQPDSMSLLTYRWYFGDGASSTETNPSHFYTNTINNTVTIILNISNTKCDSTDTATVTLNNTISGGFTFTPDPYVCQDSLVTFTNTSSGTNPTYTWLFGDGTTSTAVNPTHVYTYTGKNIQITLVAQENIMPVPVTPDTYVPCYDTVVQTISIDSFSSVSITASDSVLCQGEGITFTGIYSTLGDTTVIWSFGDGSSFVDQNPILHAYDQASLDSTFTVSLSVKNRSCPSGYTSRNVKVFPYPSIYMGPDLTMCPGSNPITLIDETNQSNPKASWLWSTGETTPGITVIKPGTYTNVVTIDGCSSADTVTVQKDCYMDIPNAFTPNGDGTNDYFFPRQMLTEGLVTFKMDIYNRWGQMIYETTNTDGRGWDGNFNNQPQPEDVYIYIIDATFKDGQIEHHQGNVTLLR